MLAQTTPHPPQLLLSFSESTQVPLHAIPACGAGANPPLPHESAQQSERVIQLALLAPQTPLQQYEPVPHPPHSESATGTPQAEPAAMPPKFEQGKPPLVWLQVALAVVLPVF